MPFTIPSLKDTRKLGRDKIAAALVGANANIPNNPLRVLSDQNAEMASLTQQYLGWISRQMLPDTAEWAGILRWGTIKGVLPKSATLASGSVTITGTPGAPLPSGAEMTLGDVLFQTTASAVASDEPVTVPVVAVVAGAAGNVGAGVKLSLTTAAAGIDSAAIAVAITGGTDDEALEDYRGRVLAALRKPPMGGDADDYVAWTLSYPGVTRAWCSPLEMGIATVTVRFMMDDLRSESGGFPTTDDVAAVKAYLDVLRPVAVKDFFVAAPITEPVNFTITNLDSNTAATRASITASVKIMIHDVAAPASARNGVGQAAQTIYAAWVSQAILQAAGVRSFDLTMADHVMPSNGSLAALGVITYA